MTTIIDNRFRCTILDYYNRVWGRISNDRFGPNNKLMTSWERRNSLGCDMNYFLTSTYNIPIVQTGSKEQRLFERTCKININTFDRINLRYFIVNLKKVACKITEEEFYSYPDSTSFSNGIWKKLSTYIEKYLLGKTKKWKPGNLTPPWFLEFNPTWNDCWVKLTSNREGDRCFSFLFLPGIYLVIWEVLSPRYIDNTKKLIQENERVLYNPT